MKSWERRLKDLAQLLCNCAETYFDPDLFRMNTNQFLQTARTITFIIQKNKQHIPNYEHWYQSNIVEAWKEDPFMKWAKDSRNIIEKEGDLELHSALHVTLIFSYLEEEDVHVTVGRAELLNAGVKKLVRITQKRLPTGIADAAAVKIERRWVTASLPDFELLHALAIVYMRIERCCSNLSEHLDSPYPESIPKSTEFGDFLETARRVQYLKIQNRDVVRIRTLKMHQDIQCEPPEQLRQALAEIKSMEKREKGLHGAMQFFEIMAQHTFSTFGNHAPMLFIFDEEWKIILHVSTEFSDQADKYIFWRSIGEKIRLLNAAGIVWVSEAWIRDLCAPSVPIRKMPIRGEELQIFGAHRAGNVERITWKIIRGDEGEPPRLERVQPEADNDWGVPFYFVPAMRAMGIENCLQPEAKHTT